MFDNGSLLRRRKRFKTLCNKGEKDNHSDDAERHDESKNEDFDDLEDDEIETSIKELEKSSHQSPNLNQMFLLTQNINKKAKNLAINISDQAHMFMNQIGVVPNTPGTISSSPSSSSSSIYSNDNSKKKINSFSIDSLINSSDDKLKLSNSSISIHKAKNSKKLNDKHLELIVHDFKKSQSTSHENKHLNMSTNTSSSRSSSRLESANSSRCCSPDEILTGNIDSENIARNINGKNYAPILQDMSAAIRLRNSLPFMYANNGLPLLNSNFPINNQNTLACSSPINHDQSYLVSALSAMSKTHPSITLQQQHLYQAMVMRAALTGQPASINQSVQYSQILQNLGQAPNNVSQQKTNHSNNEQISFSKFLPLFMPMHS